MVLACLSPSWNNSILIARSDSDLNLSIAHCFQTLEALKKDIGTIFFGNDLMTILVRMYNFPGTVLLVNDLQGVLKYFSKLFMITLALDIRTLPFYLYICFPNPK